MLVTKTSMFTGITRTLDLPVTQAQLDAYAAKQDLIQNIFPNLTPSQREFIMTGVTAEEWDAEFKEDDENHLDFQDEDEA